MSAYKKDYPESFKKQIINYYQAHSVRDVSRKFGIATQTVYKFLKESNLETRGYTISDKPLKFGLSDGMSLRERTYDFSKFATE